MTNNYWIEKSEAEVSVITDVADAWLRFLAEHGYVAGLDDELRFVLAYEFADTLKERLDAAI